MESSERRLDLELQDKSKVWVSKEDWDWYNFFMICKAQGFKIDKEGFERYKQDINETKPRKS